MHDLTRHFLAKRLGQRWPPEDCEIHVEFSVNRVRFLYSIPSGKITKLTIWRFHDQT